MRLSLKLFKILLIILDVVKQKDIVLFKTSKDFKEIFYSKRQGRRLDKIRIFAIIFLSDEEVSFILGIFALFSFSIRPRIT
jgi:hypothetical protein